MNVIKEIERITALELEAGIIGGLTNGSWHEKYKNSAWVYVGGMSYELSEGDIICFMSQWGEIEDINLVREKGTNKSMGYAFVKYEDQRSTILAVDNFNGIKLLGRVLRCDHVDRYRLPKEVLKREEELLEENPNHDVEIGPGHAYKHKKTSLHGDFDINQGIDLWAPPPSSSSSSSSSCSSNSTSNHISKSLNDDGIVESKSDDEEQDDHNKNDGEHRRVKEKKRKHDKQGDKHHHRSKKHKKEKKEKRYAHDDSEGENRNIYMRRSRRSHSPSDSSRRSRDRDRELKSSLPTVAESSVSRGMAAINPAAVTTAKSIYSAVDATTSHMSSQQQPQALSWRGALDPALIQQQQQQRSGGIAGTKSSASGSGSSSSSSNTTNTTIDHRSFGGMNRRR